MKNLIKIGLGSVLTIALCLNVNAQHRHVKHPVAKKRAVKHVVKHRTITKVHAYKFIKRTNIVVVAAHRHVKRGKVYTGDFAKSVHHQRYAKVLLAKNKPHRAIQHSRLARAYALKAIRANKGQIKKEWAINKEENEMLGDAIANDELEKELKTYEPNAKYSDESVTDKDMTELEVLGTDPADYKNE